NITDKDIWRVKSQIEEGLVRPWELSSGVDWMVLIKMIVHWYANQLKLSQYLLHSIMWDAPGAILDATKKTQVQLRVSLVSHILLDSAPLDGSNSLDWALPIFESCAMSHTSHLEGLNMMPSKKLLLHTVKERTKEICCHVGIWSSG
ncbi:hypothetical protein BKA82DRAFT_3958366, partial [Pisolithus tinctorius]